MVPQRVSLTMEDSVSDFLDPDTPQPGIPVPPQPDLPTPVLEAEPELDKETDLPPSEPPRNDVPKVGERNSAPPTSADNVTGRSGLFIPSARCQVPHNQGGQVDGSRARSL
jgi:hypothetical protein